MQCVVYSNSPRDCAIADGAATKLQVRTVMSTRTMNRTYSAGRNALAEMV